LRRAQARFFAAKSATEVCELQPPAGAPADQIADRVINARIVAEDGYNRLKIDNHTDSATGRGSESRVAEPAGRRIRQKIGVQFLHPMWRDRRTHRMAARPKTAVTRRFAVRVSDRPRRQQEIEPDQACVMGLDGHADRKAEDTGPNEPILKRSTRRHDAKTYDDSRGVAGCKEHFAIGKNKADQTCGDDWCAICPDAPHQVASKDEGYGGQNHPQQVRWAHGSIAKGAMKIDVVGKYRSLSKSVGVRPWAPVGLLLLPYKRAAARLVVGVCVLKQASRLEIDSLKIHHQVRPVALQKESQ